ncbi:MAG: glutamate formimidoyltransferase [Candidatus Riflebacteria bacterium]|nr:glutamate formimidoyltransferase [Candidatus Riflebacteria bacterium]
MTKLVECVPNFSEGRRPEVIKEIVDRMCAGKGVALLDKESDANHNRCVITLVGEPYAVKEAVLRGIAVAVERIDLTRHQGEHPRMGACDVVPFIPISGVTMAECVELARRTGEEIASRFEIPVYLYEKAASRPSRENLAEVRKGEFEGIRDAIQTDPDRKPDFGPCRVHPTAGAVAVGARMFLVAFNVQLGTTKVEVARKIADAVRYKTGGFRYVKALGFELKDRGCVQVSMNLVNYKKSPVHRVFHALEAEARRFGVPILDSELVGLIPNEALVMAAEDALRFNSDWSPRQIIENKLAELTGSADQGMGPFLDSVAAKTETPGGGSVAALAGALSAALGAMVCRFTLGKKKFADRKDLLERALVRLEELRADLTAAVSEDAAAFDAVMCAMKLPKDSEEQACHRAAKMQEAFEKAISVPLRVMERSVESLELARTLVAKGNPNLASDAGSAVQTARAATACASYNVRINLKGMDDGPRRHEYAARMQALLARAREVTSEAEAELDRLL